MIVVLLLYSRSDKHIKVAHALTIRTMTESHMIQTRYDYGEALEIMKKHVIEYAESVGIEPVEIVYNLQDYISGMPKEFHHAFNSAQVIQILDNVEDMDKEGVENWRMGDVFVAGDVADIQKQIKEDLTERLE